MPSGPNHEPGPAWDPGKEAANKTDSHLVVSQRRGTSIGYGDGLGGARAEGMESDQSWGDSLGWKTTKDMGSEPGHR